jgi:O-antigen ligase
LIYLLLNENRFSFKRELSPDEWKFIVLPIIAFVVWSSLSALWAPSWKSAIHHSLIWAEYLIFFIVFRQVVDSGDGFGKLLKVILVTLAIYATPAIIEYCAYLAVGGSTTIGMRFAKYCEQIVTILPIVLVAVVRTRGRRFAIGTAAVSLLWLLVFCSLGRANYMLFGFVIAATFLVLLIPRGQRRYLPRFALLGAVLVLSLIPIHLFLIAAPDAVVPIVRRLNDAATTANSNNFRKLMLSISEEMVSAHPVIGVGADNYGMQLNSYRAQYGVSNPDDVNLVNAEDEIPSHAHNEFVQIVAELGIVGGLIFAWFLSGIAIMAFRAVRRVRSGSPYPLAAVLGLGMFLASSLVSAYSFRVMQNGIVFFFVLAVASKLLLKRDPQSQPASRPISISPERRRFAMATGILVCLGLLAYSGVRIGSVIASVRANRTKTLERALPLYELAMRLDDENPDARQNLGMRLFRNRRYKESIPYLESAISIGRAPSAELSYLATAKTLTGDPQGAEETMASALSLYPRSPFVLTRYATVLESNGKTAAAAEMFDRAVRIDERAARSWRLMIVGGPKSLGEMAARDAGYSTVMDLQPENSIYAVVTERLIMHPEEQKYSFGKVTTDED